MAATEDGSELVNVRKVWKDEALDFTPWLADNLHLLGNTLGMKLELVQREAAVGAFSCDILAREADKGAIVAIENQLEETDFHHLGQLLTYATGCGAHVAIWVAPEFRYESARALHWLNCWTRDGLDFYGVKFEVGVTRNDTKFIAVVSPRGWNKDITLRPMEIPPETQQYHEFFRPLIVDLQRTGFAERAVQRFGPSDRHFPSPLNDGIWYAASLEGTNDAWVTLHIEMGDKKQTEHIFDTLLKQQEQIQECLAGEWHWRRHDPYFFSSISIRRDGSIDDCDEKLKETRAWMLNLLPKLKEVFDPRLAKILKEPPDSA